MVRAENALPSLRSPTSEDRAADSTRSSGELERHLGRHRAHYANANRHAAEVLPARGRAGRRLPRIGGGGERAVLHDSLKGEPHVSIGDGDAGARCARRGTLQDFDLLHARRIVAPSVRAGAPDRRGRLELGGLGLGRGALVRWSRNRSDDGTVSDCRRGRRRCCRSGASPDGDRQDERSRPLHEAARMARFS